jgi:hypothetical protein
VWPHRWGCRKAYRRTIGATNLIMEGYFMCRPREKWSAKIMLRKGEHRIFNIINNNYKIQ